MGDGPAVRKRVRADLPAVQSLLDHGAIPGRAEVASLHDGGHRLERLVSGAGDEHTFPFGEAIGLYHQRAVLLFNIGSGRTGVIEDGEGRSRDAMAAHQLLGEALRRLDLGGLAAWAEGGDALDGETVDQARRQRLLVSDDDEVDMVVAGGAHQCILVIDREGEVRAEALGPRTAGRDEEIVQPW